VTTTIKCCSKCLHLSTSSGCRNKCKCLPWDSGISQTTIRHGPTGPVKPDNGANVHVTAYLDQAGPLVQCLTAELLVLWVQKWLQATAPEPHCWQAILTTTATPVITTQLLQKPRWTCCPGRLQSDKCKGAFISQPLDLTELIGSLQFTTCSELVQF